MAHCAHPILRLRHRHFVPLPACPATDTSRTQLQSSARARRHESNDIASESESAAATWAGAARARAAPLGLRGCGCAWGGREKDIYFKSPNQNVSGTTNLPPPHTHHNPSFTLSLTLPQPHPNLKVYFLLPQHLLSYNLPSLTLLHQVKDMLKESTFIDTRYESTLGFETFGFKTF